MPLLHTEEASTPADGNTALGVICYFVAVLKATSDMAYARHVRLLSNGFSIFERFGSEHYCFLLFCCMRGEAYINFCCSGQRGDGIGRWKLCLAWLLWDLGSHNPNEIYRERLETLEA
jgi:hypothetical protein